MTYIHNVNQATAWEGAPLCAVIAKIKDLVASIHP
jgi:hypothetical protein